MKEKIGILTKFKTNLWLYYKCNHYDGCVAEIASFYPDVKINESPSTVIWHNQHENVILKSIFNAYTGY